MKIRFKNMLTSIIGYGIITIVILAAVSVFALFGATVMRFFGFEYNSVGSIILFFCITAIAGFPIEVMAKAFPKALLSLGIISLKSAKRLFFALDTLATCAAMAAADYYMDSVSATNLSIFVIALIMAALSFGDFEEKGHL